MSGSHGRTGGRGVHGPHLVLVDLLVQDVVPVADLLGRFLGLLDLPAQLGDVLLERETCPLGEHVETNTPAPCPPVAWRRVH